MDEFSVDLSSGNSSEYIFQTAFYSFPQMPLQEQHSLSQFALRLDIGGKQFIFILCEKKYQQN